MDIEEKILHHLQYIDDMENDFYKLWMSYEHFMAHVEKRKEMKHIKDEKDYIFKTLDCLSCSDEFIFVCHDKSWDNICYNKKNSWAVVFNEDGKMMTSYKVELDLNSFEKLHRKLGGKIKKGESDEKFKRAFKELRDRYKKLEG